MYFLIQGLLISVVALALLLAPEAMVAVWPWKITRMLAQIYSGPFLAYGLGSLLLSRQQTWREVRIVTIAFLILALGVIGASVIHRALFVASSPSTWIWFAGFSLIAIVLGAITLRHSPSGD